MGGVEVAGSNEDLGRSGSGLWSAAIAKLNSYICIVTKCAGIRAGRCPGDIREGDSICRALPLITIWRASSCHGTRKSHRLSRIDVDADWANGDIRRYLSMPRRTGRNFPATGRITGRIYLAIGNIWHSALQ